MKNALLVLQHR